MPLSRRKFLAKTTATAAAGSLAIGRLTAATDLSPKNLERPLLISTWPFGKAANDAALKVIQNGRSVLDAVEQGISVVEADPSNSSVGLGGKPNSAGVVQLDACIMFGPGHKAGSVGALEGIQHPISVARLVMEKTPHVMLVGEGARQFALAHGLEAVETSENRRIKDALRKIESTKGKEKNHDTIALLALGPDGTIAGGCSTSGLAGKLPGRVGDSPIIGSGLYVDNEVGAAGATGIGENVMRYCGSFLIVELMRQGLRPEEACIEVIKRIAKKDPRGFDLSINFVALNKQGEFGAAGTGKGFTFSVTTKSFSRVQQSVSVS
jgi:isoaspartyl peptidase/L-asparaginase-like protein (Ntn-hydrolase superfamily)